MKPWYATWFDTPYYSALYGEHNAKEAALFLDNLIAFLKLPKTGKYWDMNCGTGRHSIYLNQMGFEISGTDLSEKNICQAESATQHRLEFFVHDMRNPFRINYFNAVFNLFTSFGYFKYPYQDLQVFNSVKKSLKPGGKFILDYFNSNWVRNHLCQQEEKTIGNVTYVITKKLSKNFIHKQITVQDGNETHSFIEEVKLFDLPDFENLAKKCGLQIENVFGDYHLSPFDHHTSPRQILIFKS